MTNAEKFEEVFGDKIKPAWDNCGNGRTFFIITDEMCKKCDDRFNCKHWLDAPWKALEQQPCEDAVSRKEVKEAIMKCETISEDSMDGYIDSTIKLEVEIDSLPSVTPTRKKEEPILDKIRAEIVELRSKHNVDVLECLDIIDKYMVSKE